MARRNLAQQVMYRNPLYLNGKCVCCRKRMREFTHRFYPSMCAPCRETRTLVLTTKEPTPIPSLSREAIEQLQEELTPTMVVPQHVRDEYKRVYGKEWTGSPTCVQNLNTSEPERPQVDGLISKIEDALS